MRKIYKIMTGMKRVDRDELFNFSTVSELGGIKLRQQEPDSTHKKEPIVYAVSGTPMMLWDAKSGFKGRQNIEEKSTDSY